MNSSDVGITVLISELKWAESVNFLMGDPSKGTSVLDCIIPSYGPFGKLNREQVAEVHKRLARCAHIEREIGEILKEEISRTEVSETSSRDKARSSNI